MGSGVISVGDVLGGKYEIESELGAGAMGLVFSARHQALNKLVAVKTLRAEIADDAELLGRFEQEARAASAIGHPNIVEVFDLGTTAGGARYMVMEHLAGQSLADLLVVSPLLKPDRSVRIMSQVLSALAAAHRSGIVHRDLKPDNIFVTHNDENPELVKLLDFGISKVLDAADPKIAGADSAARATQFGSILGTPLYMSPEQARGLTDIDHRVDIWAVGCVLYEMMCGQPPFDGNNYNQILMNILGTKPVPPRNLRPATPPALEQVILRAMAHNRNERYASALSMREELHRSMTEGAAMQDFGPISTPPPLKPETIRTEQPGPPQPKPPQHGGGLGSSALAAASDASAAENAAFANALDNLSAGALAVGVSGEQPRPAAPEALVPKTTPMRTASPEPVAAAPAAPEPAPTSEANRFAPPSSEEGPVSLDVDLATSVPVVARTRPKLDQEIARPSREMAVARSSGSGALGKLVLGLVLLAIIGGAGYLIYQQRSVVTGKADKTARVVINVAKDAEIEIYVDKRLVRATTFEANLGQRYVVEMRAKQRLTQRYPIIGKKDLLPIKVDRLHLHYTPIVRGSLPGDLAATSSHVGKEAPTFSQVDKAFETLGLYHSCVDPVGRAVRKTGQSYARVSARDILRMRVKSLVPMTNEDVDPCRAKITRARDNGGFQALQTLATPYLESVEELNRLSQHLAKYYQGKLYQKDRGKEGAKSHKRLRRLITSALDSQNKYAAAVRAHLIEWRGHELAVMATAKDAHFHLRATLRASLAWTWSEIAAKTGAAKERAAALVTARAGLETFKKTGAAAIAKIEGADKLIAKLDEVVALARGVASGKKVDSNQLRDLHNQCVLGFNRLVL